MEKQSSKSQNIMWCFMDEEPAYGLAVVTRSGFVDKTPFDQLGHCSWKCEAWPEQLRTGEIGFRLRQTDANGRAQWHDTSAYRNKNKIDSIDQALAYRNQPSKSMPISSIRCPSTNPLKVTTSWINCFSSKVFLSITHGGRVQYSIYPRKFTQHSFHEVSLEVEEETHQLSFSVAGVSRPIMGTDFWEELRVFLSR